MTNYHIQLKKTDDVHKYFTWAPEEIEALWTIKHQEKEGQVKVLDIAELIANAQDL